MDWTRRESPSGDSRAYDEPRGRWIQIGRKHWEATLDGGDRQPGLPRMWSAAPRDCYAAASFTNAVLNERHRPQLLHTERGPATTNRHPSAPAMNAISFSPFSLGGSTVCHASLPCVFQSVAELQAT